MTETNPQPVRHIVIFRFQPNAEESQVQALVQGFCALPAEIPGILSFEHGVNNSTEGLNRGFTHVFQLTFVDTHARDAYLPHPAHQRFGQMMNGLGIIDEIFVIDYCPQSA